MEDMAFAFGTGATTLKAEEVEKLVEVAKSIDLTISKDEYLYLCNLVFGKTADPYVESMIKLIPTMLAKGDTKNDSTEHIQ